MMVLLRYEWQVRVKIKISSIERERERSGDTRDPYLSLSTLQLILVISPRPF
jgi:hypothetical protein